MRCINANNKKAKKRSFWQNLAKCQFQILDSLAKLEKG